MKVVITNTGVWIDEEKLPTETVGDELMRELYRKYVGDYPKYFKMDRMSRLGFLASELLLQREGAERFLERADRAIILANRDASIVADKAYLTTISEGDYFPSPALFVYTLPNIVTGEIAIRNRYRGETMFYVLEEESQLEELVEAAWQQEGTESALVGWIEMNNDEYTIKLELRWKNSKQN